MKLSTRFILFLLFLIEVYSVRPVRETPSSDKRNFVEGVIHVHSIFSDGGGTVPHIAEAANRANIDFLVLTDHNTVEARRQGFERRYNNTDIFVEMEASTVTGHALCFASHREKTDLSDKAMQQRCEKHVLGEKSDLFAVAAHPTHVRNPWLQLDKTPEGTEVLNFDSAWQRQLRNSPIDFLTTALVLPLNQYLSALRFFQMYSRDTISWDSANAVVGGHFGILAQDTHARIGLYEEVHLKWPDYPEAFRLASNVVYPERELSADFQERKAQIYSAIQKGRIALFFRSIFPFDGNDLTFRCGEKTVFLGEITAEKNCVAVVKTPRALAYSKNVRLIRNGEIEKEIETSEPTVEIPVSSFGTYRVEVYVQPRSLFRILLNRDVPYVLYNPIYVR